MPYKIDLASAIEIPEIDSQDEKGAIDFVGVDLFARGGIAHNQAHARGWCDGAAVLVAEAAHAGAHGLLLDDEAVYFSIFGAGVGLEVVGLVGGHGLLLLLLLRRLRLVLVVLLRVLLVVVRREVIHGGRLVLDGR